MAQIGNQNAAKGARWRDAVEKAVDHYPEKYNPGKNEKASGIFEAAYMFVCKMMEDGDIAFFKEFGDRIDGKPKQTQDINMGGEVVTQVTRKVIDPGNDAGA